MKYQSEIIHEIVEQRGHKKSSLHYQSECIETWIEEAKGAYPKLTDYQAEWLNYISILDDTGGSEKPEPPIEPEPEPEPPIGKFPYVTLTDVTEATVDNVVPYAYKSAILKGKTDENLQSVKMPVLTTTGKNLFDIDKAVKIDEEKFNETNYVSNNNGVLTVVADKWMEIVISKEIFEVNTQYTLSFKVLGTAAFHSGWIKIYHTDGSEKALKNAATPNVETFIKITSDVNKTVDRISISGNKGALPKFYDIQVEKGVQSSSYEDYKTNILTVNEDVTLRSNGDVCDELNLLTGQLTQRIGEDGSVLTQKVVKTVELSITDESGNKINHFKPIEGTMHIQTDGEPIKPTVSMEIPVEAIAQNLTSFIGGE